MMIHLLEVESINIIVYVENTFLVRMVTQQHTGEYGETNLKGIVEQIKGKKNIQWLALVFIHFCLMFSHLICAFQCCM